jgi:glyoxylase-like metal-dependent hydrolase (beta-lactamase superfamily II)
VGELNVEALYEQVRRLAPAAPDDAAPRLEPVAPGIRVVALKTPTLPPATRTNASLIGHAAGPQLLVDPGSPYADQQAALAALLEAEAAAGRPLALIALTHHHGDHVGGAAALAARWGVPVAAHARTKARLAGKVAIARELGDGEVIAPWGVTCIHTPGHADGHLCFAQGGAIVAGDMVAGIGTILVDPSEGNMGEYVASLARLLALAPAVLLPAHGPAIPDAPDRLRAYLAHRAMREARVADALAARAEATLADLVPVAYDDTPPALWPLAARSLEAHLIKLVAEGRARVVAPGRWASS